jgi:hypothetical protein
VDTTGHLVDTDAAGLTLDQAAVRAGCSVKTLRRAITLGTLPHHRVQQRRGQAIIVQPADLDAWLLEREQAFAVSSGPGGSDQQAAMSTGDRPVQEMPAEAGHDAGQSTALVPLAAVSEMIGRTMAPLVTRLGEAERTLGAEQERRRIAEERAAAAEENAARLAAELALLRDQEAPRRPWWRRWGRDRPSGIVLEKEG